MLVTIGEFALEKLAESGERDEIAERHALAYLALAEEARAHLQGEGQKKWLDLLGVDHDNMRAGLEWAITRGRAEHASRMAFPLWRGFAGCGPLVLRPH